MKKSEIHNMNNVYIVHHQDIDVYAIYRIGSIPNIVQAVKYFTDEINAAKWCKNNDFVIV